MEENIKVVIISPLYKAFSEELKNNGFTPVFTNEETGIKGELSYHADINCLDIKTGDWFLSSSQKNIAFLLKIKGYNVHTIKDVFSPIYPNDVFLNAAIIGKNIFANIKTISTEVLQFIKKCDFRVIDIRQGYAKCSIAFVDELSLITSDRMIAKAAFENGFDVCLIKEGFIKLPGYDYGFIGGCSGKLQNDNLFFSGNIKEHPDYSVIKDFCSKHKVKIVVLAENEPLTDIGGMLPVF